MASTYLLWMLITAVVVVPLFQVARWGAVPGFVVARLIVVTPNDAGLTRKLVAALRLQYPEVRIFARGHNIEACQALNRLGAASVVSENVEASLELSRMAMDGFSNGDVED